MKGGVGAEASSMDERRNGDAWTNGRQHENGIRLGPDPRSGPTRHSARHHGVKYASGARSASRSIGRVKEPHRSGATSPGVPNRCSECSQVVSRIHPAGPPGTPTHPIARGLASLNPRACPPRPGGFFCAGPEVPRTQWTTWSFLCAPGPMTPDILKDSKSARNNLTKQQLCGESGKVVTSGWSLPILPSKKFNPGKTKVIDSNVFLDTLTLERRSFRGLRAPGVCFRGRRESETEKKRRDSL